MSDEEIEKVPDDAGEGLNDADIYDDEGYVRASYLAHIGAAIADLASGKFFMRRMQRGSDLHLIARSPKSNRRGEGRGGRGGYYAFLVITVPC